MSGCALLACLICENMKCLDQNINMSNIKYSRIPMLLLGTKCPHHVPTRVVDTVTLTQQNLTRLNAARPESSLVGLAHDSNRGA